MHETMSILGLAKLVKEMREAERLFRETPGWDSDLYRRSIELEKRVDAALKEVLEPGLFGEGQ